jgi:glycosyltransferase involved in cell wall biosynthesis
MRVLLANKYWHRKGGAETYLFALIAELEARGFELVPFGMKHPRNAESPYHRFFVDEVDYDSPSPWYSKLRTAERIVYSRHARRRMAALLDEVKPDLAHAHNIYHQLSPAILPELGRRGIPVVMTLHDLKLACPAYKMRTHGELCERCLGGGYHHAIARRCVRDSVLKSAVCAFEAWLHRSIGIYEKNVSRFIVPSRFYLSKMKESGIPAEKLVCIPNFTDLTRFEPRYEATDYCVYFGRLSEEKGLPTLLSAMEGMNRGRLVILGEGPLRPRLTEFVAERRLGNVEILGPKAGRELQDLVAGARFSVIPSEWYENCPLSGIESFASGTPVLAAAIGGLPEMVEDGVTGLLFEPFSAADLRDKMTRLFGDDELISRLGRGARAKAEREYDTHSHMTKLLQVYSSALERRVSEVAS